MTADELTSSWVRIALVVLSSSGMLAGTIVYVRLAGLRTFSKLSAFDFAVTVAFGSLLGSVALSGSSLLDGLAAAGTLIGLQALLGAGRSRIGLGRLVDNTPLLLMADGQMLSANLRRARVTEHDVWASLRAANVTRREQVLAVVLETTGDVSVLHGDGPVDADLLAGVRGSDLRGC